MNEREPLTRSELGRGSSPRSLPDDSAMRRGSSISAIARLTITSPPNRTLDSVCEVLKFLFDPLGRQLRSRLPPASASPEDRDRRDGPRSPVRTAW